MDLAIRDIAPKGRLPGHAIRWYVVNPNGTKTRRPSGLQARGCGFDVECECGWKSRTGGGVESYVKRCIAEHKWDVAHGYLSDC
jgi:hypothetical protein